MSNQQSLKADYKTAVSPIILPNGAVSSLLDLAPINKCLLSGNGPKALPRTVDVSVNFGVISSSFAAQAGFEELLSFKTSKDSKYLMSEVQIVLPSIPGRSDSIIKNEYYGVGWRLCVKAWDLENKGSLSVESVAAECTIKKAYASMQTHVYGIQSDLLADIMPPMSSVIGNFNVEAMQQITIIEQAMNDLLSSEDEEILSKMNPVLIGVDLKDDFEKPYQDSPSAVFAFHAIWKNYSFNEAIKRIPKDLAPGIVIDPRIVSQIYDVLLGADRNERPPEDVRNTAYKSVFREE